MPEPLSTTRSTQASITRWTVRASFAFVALASLAACGRTPSPAPDLIFVNARIWTGDSTHPAATAIAITGDRIVAVGDDASIRALADASTTIEDLEGRRVIPGMHDGHWHLPSRRTADLVGATTPGVIVERLRTFAAELPADAWITGRGWTPNVFPENRAHRRFLDAAFPNRPVIITDRDGHQVLANSAALRLASVSGETRDPTGGVIVRDRSGTPTGLLQESAMQLVRRFLPDPGTDEVYALLRAEMHRAAAVGLTSLQLANAAGPALDSAFARAMAEDSMLTRFRIAVPFARDVSDSALRTFTALHARHRGPLLRYGVAKGMLDGTIDAGTAAMLEPYSVGDGRGLPFWERDALVDALVRYDRAGIQVQLHAIGDGAIRLALDVFAELAERNGPRDRRPRIEHLEAPHPDDLPRFKALGVIASTQAIFATPDATGLSNYSAMLGAERIARTMPFRALDDAGAIQAFGSDYPVFPMDPLLGIYTAVTRTLGDGTPRGGWYPQHRISVEAALRHYTWGAAYAAYRESEIGTLAPSYLADLVVLSEEIIGTDSQALLRARPVVTLMGGRVTYRAPQN